MDFVNGDEWGTDKAVANLDGEIIRASARLRQRRAERRETFVFIIGALALALLAAIAIPALVNCGENAMGIVFCVMALTLIFAPILAWFCEEGRYESEIEQ